MEKFRMVIVGFGNIGRAVLNALPDYPDFECVGIITRNPNRVRKEISDIPLYAVDESLWMEIDADVAILCGGSKDDLPVQGPLFARYFNTVCSFDTHAHIDNYRDPVTQEEKTGYYHVMDNVARNHGNTAMVCQGWDPGIFSLMRALFTACLGEAKAEGFYGLSPKGGLSMGHSDALRTVPGVKDARQYTHAKPETIGLFRSGSDSHPTPGDMHWRECLVVPAEDANREAIEHAIVTMPNYFAPFATTVRFVTQEELDRDHSDMPHDGLVIGVAPHGSMEFRNAWKSNPRGTAGILLAYARAAVRYNEDGVLGALTALEVAPIALLRDSGETTELRFV